MHLRSYTIIPQSLYVEREADRQLRRNLLEMERPAYVLVARQMGKTNLLLNAKRQSSDSEIFCYIDASNPLPDLRAFLRSVSDACIESFPAELSSAMDYIKASRSNDLIEHKEHENELRAILRSFDGKLIVCIDEIDALTRTDYSDRIFSLIRSIYFSGRTNFPEFARLTYVLSGVAEPTEIIKDRSISPFNIGEKIYLNDFSNAEVDDFLLRANLSISNDVRHRLVYWTGGNPRMTWDVCSGLSEIRTTPTCADIDRLVDRLYLRAFDLPPVDHIRTLAETDREIRDSLIALHYRRQDAISDAVKTRLYLAGITSVDPQSGVTRFKNKIIEEALSEQWLKHVEQKDLSLFETAQRLFSEGRFHDAVKIFESIEPSSVTETWRVHYYTGLCFYNLSDYKRAIEYFEKSPVTKSQSIDFYYREQSLLGSAMLRDDRIDRAIDILEATIVELQKEYDSQPNDWLFQCALNLGAAYLSSSPPNLHRSIDLCERVLETCDSGTSLDPKEVRRYRDAALSTLTTAQNLLGEKSEALRYLDQAITESEGGEKISLLLQRATQFESRAERGKTLAQCVHIYLENDVHIDQSSEAPNAFTTNKASELLLELASSPEDKDLEKLLKKMSQQASQEDSISIAMSDAIAAAFQRRGRDVSSRLLSKVSSLPYTKPNADHRQLVAMALMMGDADPKGILEQIFINTYLDADSKLEAHEHRTIYELIQLRLLKGNIGRARAAYVAGNEAMERSIKLDPDSFSHFERLIFEYLDLATSVSDAEGFIERVVDLRKRIEACEVPPSAYYPSAFKNEILMQLARLDASFSPKTYVRTMPKIGRNQIVSVRFANGSIASGKYKKFEDRLHSGEAELIL